MRIKKFNNNKKLKRTNEVVITGKILSNKDNMEFGDSLYAIHPFNGDSLVPLVVESSTTHLIETDDGFEDTKKNLFNVNLYNDLIDKVTDNDDFYIGSRVKIKGYLISKNFAKTEEKKDVMNLCNRYKNLHDGERPLLYVGDKPFVDKETGISYDKNYIDWNLLLADDLVDNIPEEEEQDLGKVEYFFIEDGRVFRQEHKTNYIVMAKEIEPLDGFLDPSKGDDNYIEVVGSAKDVYVNELEGYHFGHICVVSKSDDMTRNSYIHAILKAKNLDILKAISIEDLVKVKGRLKHRVIEKTFTKKKGKKEFVITQYTNFYEIDCRELEIYKNN